MCVQLEGGIGDLKGGGGLGGMACGLWGCRGCPLGFGGLSPDHGDEEEDDFEEHACDHEDDG